jgi:hypothetical protein
MSDYRSIDVWLILTMFIFLGAIFGLNAINPALPPIFLIVMWSIAVGITTAFDAESHGIKYAGFWLSVRTGASAVVLAMIAYHGAGWQGVFEAMWQMASMFESALVVAIVSGILIGHWRRPPSSES